VVLKFFPVHHGGEQIPVSGAKLTLASLNMDRQALPVARLLAAGRGS
jgi:hypothetical protein